MAIYNLQGEEEEEEEGGSALPAPPAITLHAAREAAALVANFMAQNASEFGKDVEFSFERSIAAPMSKMMIARLKNRKQSTLDNFFS
jgi:hypothetical protein